MLQKLRSGTIKIWKSDFDKRERGCIPTAACKFIFMSEHSLRIERLQSLSSTIALETLRDFSSFASITNFVACEMHAVRREAKPAAKMNFKKVVISGTFGMRLVPQESIRFFFCSKRFSQSYGMYADFSSFAMGAILSGRVLTSVI